ncbi:MAG TPA: muconolactone Delta-isomerase family protein [Ferrovibrio sp.]|uniref:muconolactone Delta-isomerase family protein n=1 Tax=Ferrovibrio sp. TaxID=1917215 RepID=UPI002ED291A9
MLFLIDVTFNFSTLGDRAEPLVKAEWKVEEELLEKGQFVGIWRKANSMGTMFILDLPSHAALSDQIRAMPLYPFFTDVRVTPLIGHPNFPQFARGAATHEKPGSKPAPDSILHLVDVRIEYARAGDKLQELVQAEWRASEQMLAKRQLVGIWRKGNALGTYVLWNLPDADAVSAQLRSMPLYPCFTDITVTPLVLHPNFPQFARPAEHHEKPV